MPWVGEVWRVAFAFDPERQGILLIEAIRVAWISTALGNG
ncbi:toxin HigB [Rhodoferax lithotrophicus]|uniref:Toxin HigB n=1 Tax=Rhodoferax lithotrophicus TaxID=2798804 RepID=A0ABM7MNC9_9BURK|nr:toxin HigB [Rhodoferax sp. MIZ03]